MISVEPPMCETVDVGEMISLVRSLFPVYQYL